MSKWKKYKLGEIAKRITSGGTPSTRMAEYYGGNIPWLRTQEVNFNRIYDTEIKITDEAIKNSSAKMIAENSIIVAMYGATAGRIAINKIPLTTNQACCNISLDDKKADYNFVYYFLKSKFGEILNMATGAAQQNLNAGMLRDFEITAPDLATQTQIAQILTSLDDKIELNLQMNQTLEAMAQALFKEWFVNFNFPNFDGELENGLPLGWRMGKLNDISLNFDNKRVPLSSMQRKDKQGIYPYYGAATIFDYIDEYIFDGTYLLMGEDGTVQTDEGFPLLQYVWDKFWVNNHTHVLQGKSPFSTEYLYLLLSKTNITHLITGAVQPKINQGNMNKIECVLPSEEILNDFQKVINPVFEKIKSNKIQIQTLTQTRETLLPKLMSGKIKIKS